MDAIVPERFDYSIVDDDTRRKLISVAGDINRTKKAALAGMMEMGEAIATAQELLSKNGDGTFNKWIESECGISHQSAHNYMRSYRLFGDCKSLLQSFTQEAMYKLAAPSTPPEAVKKAIKSAQNGIRVTEPVAKQIIKSVAPPRQNTPRKSDEEEAAEEPEEELPEVRAMGEGDCLGDVQDDLKEFCRRLRDLAKLIKTIVGYENKQITRPYCGQFSLMTIHEPLLHVARSIETDMPVGGTPKRPILFHEQKVKELA